MTDTPPDPQRFPIGTTILLVLSVLLYAATMGSLSDATNSDAAGRGLALAFGAIFATVLFLVLGVLLFVSAVRGDMPVAAKIGAPILLPLAIVAVWVAADAYGARDRSALLVPALLPPLFAIYAVWARFPSLQARIPARAATLMVGGLILALVAMPLLRVAFPPERDPVAEARAVAEEKERRAEEERLAKAEAERNAQAFAALGPDSKMEDYLDYLYGDRGREAREGIRSVKSRQADSVALLQAGRLRDLSRLLEFDVEATPALCQAYGAALDKAARQVDPKVRSDYLTAALDLEDQIPNIQWLVGERCDLKAPLELLEKNLRAVADSSRITKFADTLKELRSR